MSVHASYEVKQTSSAMRLILLVASILVLSVGISLYLLTEQTDRMFAWTINPPLTAAFLGAGYWASFLLEYLSSRERTWAQARLAVPAVLLFTILTLIATLLHLDRFHFNAPLSITRAGTWFWMVVYITVPPALALIWFHQSRQPGSDPPVVSTLPAWLRLTLILQAVVTITFGGALFLLPTIVSPLWPWELTALTGRAVGAWLVGIGLAVAHAAWENEWTRLEAMMASTLAFGNFQSIALLRYFGTILWDRPSAWLYVLYLLSVVFVGLYGWRASRQVKGTFTAGRIPT